MPYVAPYKLYRPIGFHRVDKRVGGQPSQPGFPVVHGGRRVLYGCRLFRRWNRASFRAVVREDFALPDLIVTGDRSIAGDANVAEIRYLPAGIAPSRAVAVVTSKSASAGRARADSVPLEAGILSPSSPPSFPPGPAAVVELPPPHPARASAPASVTAGINSFEILMSVFLFCMRSERELQAERP